MDISALRLDYTLAGLRRNDLDPDPIAQFGKWFGQVLEARLREPNAMTLATVDSKSCPTARIVLLKTFDARGFCFYSNYESGKGRDLAQNPAAALVFFWSELERQVRVTGKCSRLGRSESESYFKSRPFGSQLSAWVSKQTEVIENRDLLETRLQEVSTRFRDSGVPLPPYWGGYLLEPVTVEFWQGRPNRLHDRFRYTAEPGTGWRIDRLSP